MLKCEARKKPIRIDFTPHTNKGRYYGALWAVYDWFTINNSISEHKHGTKSKKE